MNIMRFEAKYAEQVAKLLNEHLPFEEESAQTVIQAGGIQYIAIVNDEVVGYIAGYLIQNTYNEFPYFEKELLALHQLIDQHPTFYTSHLVVHPDFRGRGIGKALVAHYMDAVKNAAEAIVVVGWVKSDTNKWDAEKQFKLHQFSNEIYINRYFKPYDVYCPSCAGLCYCDAKIIWKHLI